MPEALPPLKPANSDDNQPADNSQNDQNEQSLPNPAETPVNSENNSPVQQSPQPFMNQNSIPMGPMPMLTQYPWPYPPSYQMGYPAPMNWPYPAAPFVNSAPNWNQSNPIPSNQPPVQAAGVNQAMTAAQKPEIVRDITKERTFTDSAAEIQASDWPPKHLTEEERPKIILEAGYALPKDADGNVDIIRLVNNMLVAARTNKASDIHIEPKEKYLQVRFRIDGEFKEYQSYTTSLINPVLTRIIILSGLQIDKTRVPQDGKMTFSIEGQEIDVRVSTFPTMYGDKIVMRLLERDARAKSLQDLGFRGKSLEAIQQNMERTYGMVLITGPTGSGKSTTLFAMLSAYDPFKFNISTLEDPIEYVIANVNQAQVHSEIGFDFADGLRSLVRQDPDIIMIGEIRDKISANLAVQASLTGHLVFATVHANTAASTIQRLTNMGVDPFLVASALNVIISQRLVRKNCEHCKVTVTPPPRYIESIKNLVGGEVAAKKINFMKGQGCEQCNFSGYKGRIAIYEVLPVTAGIEKVIIEHPIATYIQEAAVKEGMATIKENGLALAIQGKTSLEEVLLAVDEAFL